MNINYLLIFFYKKKSLKDIARIHNPKSAKKKLRNPQSPRSNPPFLANLSKNSNLPRKFCGLLSLIYPSICRCMNKLQRFYPTIRNSTQTMPVFYLNRYNQHILRVRGKRVREKRKLKSLP